MRFLLIETDTAGVVECGCPQFLQPRPRLARCGTRHRSAGNLVRLGSLQKDAAGHAIVELFGDLKRHDMGSCLAESIDEVGTGASVFLTENLWGVGSTAPYLHDGRASTLREATLAHCGEADAARKAFLGLALRHQDDLFAFLNNLVLFKLEEEEE